jgi:hypothetical protein
MSEETATEETPEAEPKQKEETTNQETGDEQAKESSDGDKGKRLRPTVKVLTRKVKLRYSRLNHLRCQKESKSIKSKWMNFWS